MQQESAGGAGPGLWAADYTDQTFNLIWVCDGKKYHR